MTEEIKRCYRVLDLEVGASQADVKGAWREMVKVWHPDRFPDDAKLKAKGVSKLSEINRAYEILEAYLRTAPPPPQDPTTTDSIETKRPQSKKRSSAGAKLMGALIVAALFIGLDILRVSRAEKNEAETRRASEIRSKQAADEREQQRREASLESQKQAEEAAARERAQQRLVASLELQKQAEGAAAREREQQRLAASLESQKQADETEAKEREQQRLAAAEAKIFAEDAKTKERVRQRQAANLEWQKQYEEAKVQVRKNGLGMEFVPVLGTTVLFSIWPARVQDFEAFVRATGHDATAGMYSYSLSGDSWSQRGGTWKSPGFAQGPTQPVCGVSWGDAQAFCAWLTTRERAAGRLGPNLKYRLPTDAEWSVAVGLRSETGNTPMEKDGRIAGVYPWGSEWPPPRGVGNYGASLMADDFVTTSPVGSFPVNSNGLYDMGGNVSQWCEDFYDGNSGERVLRGGSFNQVGDYWLLSSIRFRQVPGYRIGYIGFRVVVAVAGASSP